MYAENSNTRKSRLFLISLPALAFLMIFVCGLACIFIFSFWHFEQSKRIAMPDICIENYVRFLGDPFFYQFLWRTMRIGAITTLCCLAMGYPVAYVQARSRNLTVKRLLMMAVVVTALIGVVNRSYSWLILLGTDGPINYVLMKLGLDSGTISAIFGSGADPVVKTPWTLLFNEFAVVVGLVHRLLPFMIIFLSISIENVDVSLENVSRSLGMSPLGTFFKVTLPLSLPGAFAGSLFVFGLSASDYVMPSLLGGLRVKTMSNLIYENALMVMNYPFGAAIAFIMMAMIVIAFIGVVAAFRVYRWNARRRSLFKEDCPC